LADDVISFRAHFADFVHPHERDDDRAAVERNLPADEARVAALRYDRRLRFLRKLQNLRNFLRRSRLQHERRAAFIKVARLAQKRLHRIPGERVFLAGDFLDALKCRGRKRGLRNDLRAEAHALLNTPAQCACKPARKSASAAFSAFSDRALSAIFIRKLLPSLSLSSPKAINS